MLLYLQYFGYIEKAITLCGNLFAIKPTGVTVFFETQSHRGHGGKGVGWVVFPVVFVRALLSLCFIS
jgi:hypothetical protein